MGIDWDQEISVNINYDIPSIIAITLIMFAFIGTTVGIYILNNEIQETVELQFMHETIRLEKEIGEENEEIIGGDTDDYGCIIAAGYSWCEKSQKCFRSWEEDCE